MDLLSLLRTLGGLGMVLGMLAGALWLVRRYDIALPGRVSARAPTRRVSLIERVALDSRRSVVLLRRDNCEHLFLLLPDGATILESRTVPQPSGKNIRRVS